VVLGITGIVWGDLVGGVFWLENQNRAVLARLWSRLWVKVQVPQIGWRAVPYI